MPSNLRHTYNHWRQSWERRRAIGRWRPTGPGAVGAESGPGLALAVAASGACAGYVATPLGSLGGTVSLVYGINKAGQAVGYSTTAGSAAYHATLWTGGMVIDLNDFLDPFDRAAGWLLSDEDGGIHINNSAWIVTTAFNDVMGGTRAYLLTPDLASVVPKPQAWVLMLAALGGVAAAVPRRPSA